MRVLDVEASQVEAAREFLIVNGWVHRVGDSEHFATLVRNSQRTAVALAGTEIVGFARAITDGLSNGYLSMQPAGRRTHHSTNLSRASARLVITRSAPSTACTWITRLARSDPTRTAPSRITLSTDFPL